MISFFKPWSVYIKVLQEKPHQCRVMDFKFCILTQCFTVNCTFKSHRQLDSLERAQLAQDIPPFPWESSNELIYKWCKFEMQKPVNWISKKLRDYYHVAWNATNVLHFIAENMPVVFKILCLFPSDDPVHTKVIYI